MMYRFVAKTGFILTVIAILVIAASLVVGSTLPDDLQYVWALPRQNRWQKVAAAAPFPIRDAMYTYLRPMNDQWSTVGLYSTERRLSATVQLPIRTQGVQWDTEGDFAMISGIRNSSTRTYQMVLTPDNSRLRWLKSAAAQPLSPDGRWMVINHYDASGKPIGLKAVPSDQIDQHLNPNGEDVGNVWFMLWAKDSRYFVYNWGPNLVTQPNRMVITPSELRLHDVETGAEEQLDAYDPNVPQYVDLLSVVQLRLIPKPQPYTARMMTQPSLRYSTVLYDRKADTETEISDEGLFGATWSASGRYLLFQEYAPTITEVLGQAIFRSAPMSMPGWSQWMVFYHEASGTLLTAEMANGMSAPFHYMGGMGYQYGMRSHNTYLFDRQTGQKRLIASNSQYGREHYAYWMPESDILMIFSQSKGEQYYMQPDGEPTLLQHEGKKLSLAYHGVKTIGVEITQSSVSGSLAGPGGFISTMPPYGMSSGNTEYYLVDLENENITPVSLEEDEVITNVDYSLQRYGVDVGIVTTMDYNGASMITNNAPPPTSIYLITQEGIVPLALNLQSYYVQPYGIDEDEFILTIMNSYSYPQSPQTVLHVIYRDGRWQHRQIEGDFAGLQSWRPSTNEPQSTVYAQTIR